MMPFPFGLRIWVLKRFRRLRRNFPGGQSTESLDIPPEQLLPGIDQLAGKTAELSGKTGMDYPQQQRLLTITEKPGWRSCWGIWKRTGILLLHILRPICRK